MSAHLLYQDFFRFIDALIHPGGDPWDLYERHYLGPNRAVLTAWWEQCMGLPREVWTDRVCGVRAEDYGLLRELVGAADLTSVASETMARCQRTVQLSPEPEVYFLVGFFSPDGFTFEVAGRWAIGIGMERMTGLNLLPALLAHEYMHCYRNRWGRPGSLGQRMVEEGFAVEMVARAFPEESPERHLMVRPGQLSVFREYEERLWKAVAPLMGSEDEALAAKVLFGRAGPRDWPSRAGVYLGWVLVKKFLEREPEGLEAPPERVLAIAAEGRC